MAKRARFLILNGPSVWNLIVCMFHGCDFLDEGETLVFKLRRGHICFEVNIAVKGTIKIGHSSTHFRVEGWALDWDNRPWVLLHGEYNVQTRKGWLEEAP